MSKASDAVSWRAEFRGGVEATIHGFSTAIGPILIFGSFFGAQSLAVAIWAALVTATVVPAIGLLFRGSAAVMHSTRAASLTAYAALIFQLSMAGAGTASRGAMPTAEQFVIGLAGGGILFALASLLILLAGAFKFGYVFKMIPSTVTAGISNSTAALLVWLALKQVIGSDWLAGLAALAMVAGFKLWSVLQLRFLRLRLIPNLLIAVLAGVLVSLWAHNSVSQPVALVSHDFASMGAVSWPGLSLHQLWQLLLTGLPGAVTLALVMMLETLTTNSVMESRFGLRIEVNRQLVALGASNLASALLGGVPCTGSLVRSLANWHGGGRGPLAALFGLLLTGALMVLLGKWLLVMPAGVIAGLFLLQAPVLVDPLFKDRLAAMVRSRRVSYGGSVDLGFWIILLITLAGIFGGLIWASFMGIALSGMVVLRKLSGSLTSRWDHLDRYRSRRVRSRDEVALLDQLALQVGVLRLTGHLFFGNSMRLMQLPDELPPQATVVVIDLSLLQDVDPSGLTALRWLVRALADRSLKVVLSGAQQARADELRLELDGLSGVTHCIDLDRGLELCEEHVLASSVVAPERLSRIGFAGNALLKGFTEQELDIVLALLEPRQASRGDLLFRQGDPADGIWLLEQGQLSILTGPDGVQRLGTFGPGQFMGEMGYVDGGARSADARADSPLRAALLSQTSLAELALRCPGAALKIVHNIARELSHRVRVNSARSRASDGT